MVARSVLDGRYRLVEALGAGGMSIVWRGFDEVLQRDIAVKLLNPDLITVAELRQRIRREARAAARLSHPHIAGVFDYGEAPVTTGVTVPFVVMELVAGEALSERVSGGARLPWRDAVTVCAQVASALAEAHRQGVVHRDIKPSNVILTAAGAKVIDFGISALAGESEVGADGRLLGTPAYVAPERMDGGRAGSAADVYGLGVLVYRVLAGRLPWQASTTTGLLTAHRDVEPAPLPDLDEIPEAVVELCHRCLAKDPENRPASADVARALAAAAGIAVHNPGFAVATAAPRAEAPTALITVARTLAPTVAAPVLTFAESLRRSAERLISGHLARVDRLRTRARELGARAQPTTLRTIWTGVAAAMLIVTAAAWMQPSTVRSTLAAAGASSDPAACAVHYKVQRSWWGGFAGAVRVTNSGERDLADATLRFTFPGTQRIARNGSLTQAGREVRAPVGGSGRPLAAGSTVELRFVASYRSENPLPIEFFLGETRCGALVSGPDPEQSIIAGASAAAGDAVGSPGRAKKLGKNNGNNDQGEG